MKKVSHYRGDSFFFHANVLAAKRNSKADPTYKQRMEQMLNVSKSQFQEYDQRFDANTLERMSQRELTSQDTKDFLRLYSSSDKQFVDLKEKLSCDDAGHEYPYCPLCDISEAPTLDHILPQSQFPVLCDHPRNLIRSCYSCNDWKNDDWLENGKRRYLNLYIDDVPDIQMLFVRLDVEGGDIVYDYYVNNCNGVDAEIFRKYKNTFDDFHLKDRYEFLTNEEITTLKSRIKNSLDIFHATDDQIKDDIRRGARDEQTVHGVNYWRAILKLAICDNDVVFQMLK